MFIQQSIYLPTLFSHAHCLYLHFYRTDAECYPLRSKSPSVWFSSSTLDTGDRGISIPCTLNDAASSSKGVPSVFRWKVDLREDAPRCTGNYSMHTTTYPFQLKRDKVEQTKLPIKHHRQRKQRISQKHPPTINKNYINHQSSETRFKRQRLINQYPVTRNSSNSKQRSQFIRCPPNDECTNYSTLNLLSPSNKALINRYSRAPVAWNSLSSNGEILITRYSRITRRRI